MTDEAPIAISARNKLEPLIPIVSVVVNFAVDESITIDENLQLLNATIASILVQDYINLEIIVVSDCYFWHDYVKFATEAKRYGTVVNYMELSVDESIQGVVKGEYLLLMNVGELLTYSAYLTTTIKTMVTNPDIGIAFANYSLIEGSSHVVILDDGLGLLDSFVADSWTKIPGQWLFFNYDKVWCMPGTTLFRFNLDMDDLNRNIRNLNKFIFLRILLETDVAFYNHVVGKCYDGFDSGNGKLTLGNCDATLEYIDLATVDAVIAGCSKADVQNWRNVIVKKYFCAIINRAEKDHNLLTGLYDTAQKFGVVKLLYEAMTQIVCNENI